MRSKSKKTESADKLIKHEPPKRRGFYNRRAEELILAYEHEEEMSVMHHPVHGKFKTHKN